MVSISHFSLITTFYSPTHDFLQSPVFSAVKCLIMTFLMLTVFDFHGYANRFPLLALLVFKEILGLICKLLKSRLFGG